MSAYLGRRCARSPAHRSAANVCWWVLSGQFLRRQGRGWSAAPARPVPVWRIMGGNGPAAGWGRVYIRNCTDLADRGARVGSCVIFKTSFWESGNKGAWNGIAVSARKWGNAGLSQNYPALAPPPRLGPLSPSPLGCETRGFVTFPGNFRFCVGFPVSKQIRRF